MARRTIKGELLKWWRARGDVSFTEARVRYWELSRELDDTPQHVIDRVRRYIRTHARGCSWDYISMNLTRILKENGRKLGPAGSRAKWRFGRNRRVVLRVEIESSRDDFLNLPTPEICRLTRELFEPDEGERVLVHLDDDINWDVGR